VKVVIFCGGLGLRLRDASELLPKPLLPVGDQPILLHLMKYYAHYGHTDFILCLGYKAHAFKEYFLGYNEALQNDFVLHDGGRRIELLDQDIDTWRITFVDTGRSTNIGGRLRAVREHVGDDEYFLANYGDQLTDAPLPAMIDQVVSADKVAGLISVKPTYSTHVLKIDETEHVTGVSLMDDGALRINGGFFTFRRDIFDYMRPGEELVEEPFTRLMEQRQLVAYHHTGFWAPMDTLKDKQDLDALAETAEPPWAVWINGGNRARRPVSLVRALRG